MPSSGNYNLVDRVLHRFAFCHPIVQKVLAELESDLFKRDLAAAESRREVFITGLPRAGTTLMLELLNATGEFTTYTYRNMPFVLAPLLWNKLSRSFQKSGTKAERAHGDGMQVSYDSPEAFEEVVWLTHMADKIVQDRFLATLSADDITEDFGNALRDSVRKLLALAAQAEPGSLPPRYLSKNNANISRIDALQKVFPEASILVLFRKPPAHVSSLAKQHERFLKVHSDDAFSRQYMKWIGHYEFGENFRPINFDGWLDDAGSPAADETFWMRYWSAAYSYAIERRAPAVHFVDFDKLLQDRELSLGRIAALLDLEREESLVASATALRAPTSRPIKTRSCAAEVWERAQDVHAQLRSLAA